MSYFSDKAIEQNEKSNLSELDKTICIECVKDAFLERIVLNNAISNRCSYCNKKFRSHKAASYNIVMHAIYDGIYKYYGDAYSVNLPYSEGEWLFEAHYIGDILFKFDPGWCEEFYCDIENSADPFQYLVPHTNNSWLELPENEVLMYSWDSFKDQVLYKTRYLFLNEPIDEINDEQIIPVSQMLNALEDLCIEFNLVKKIRKKSLFYRVRSQLKDESFSEFNHMGVAPQKIASAGRMNPGGIPYFYIADSALTAKLEVIKDQEYWSYATFKLKKDIEVIDFSNLPKIPSIFDVNEYSSRQKLMFLYDLVSDMSKPVGPDVKDHIEYIPTQVVSEFFRYRFNPKVKGIRYKSVKNKEGINIAFFESDNEKIKDYFELLNIERN
ncbi:hypothetical protein [Acinetobacter bereziniae]|uniref:HEPN-associated N-terminal domain-containing protein n=1 Tax=Acinetobacter bereziniae TaxID=106648 RepID=UPI000574E850|nr:HEPN-associated N-terminal domain-containing protein [Acinetobacter bereziniae]CEI54458.1 hypothetical protein [Acinetobacter bereziniae]